MPNFVLKDIPDTGVDVVTAMFGVRDEASDLMLVAQYGTVEMLKSLLEKGTWCYR